MGSYIKQDFITVLTVLCSNSSDCGTNEICNSSGKCQCKMWYEIKNSQACECKLIDLTHTNLSLILQ